MPGAVIARRSLLGAAPLLALAGLAKAATRDLALTCDTTLAPALRKASAAWRAKTGAQVFVHPTGPGLILPQLQRQIQNDILVSQLSLLDQALHDGLIAAAAAGPRWRNPLVIAGPRGSPGTEDTLAAPDPTPACDIDGPALLAQLDLKPRHMLGAVDTDEVAYLLRTGAAQAGLLHLTDVRANPDLDVLRALPADVAPPRVYAACVTKLARRPDPAGFVAFLTSMEAAALLGEAGLELQT
jgi:molybdate transport system substrate-binding protein